MKNNRRYISPTAAATLIAAVVGLAIAALFYYKVDPASGLMPRCVFHTLTGYDCPGCGFQRALHALLHGHIAQAWHYNAFAFFALPTAIFYIIVESLRKERPHLHRIATHPLIISIIMLSIILWWVFRNINIGVLISVE